MHVTRIIAGGRRSLVASLAVLGLVTAALVAVAPAPSAQAALPAVSTVHPRLLVTASGFANLKKQFFPASKPVGALATAVMTEADSYLTAPVVKYTKPDGIRLLATSETVVKHAYALGMAYKMTGNRKYADRLWTDLNAARQFPDWNPNHFLDTAEMTNAFAISYDWLYSYWSSAQRSALVSAIVTKGLTPSLPVYRAAPTSSGPYKYGGNWSQLTNNWNVVVNSGMAIGALSVMNESPTVAKAVLGYSLSSIGKGVSSYANGGGWAEGLGYWEYATRYLTLLTGALTTSTGSDRGLLERPGVAQTGYFPLYAATASTSFSFADSPSGIYRSSAITALGKQLGDPVLTGAAAAPNGFGSNVQRLFSLASPAPQRSLAAAGLPLDRTFGNAGVTTFHSSWTDPLETFAAFRSSNTPKAGHQNLDAGTFSLGALGTTWAEELGKDDYGLTGYFDSGSAGDRWNYYRERAEGQNTLIIDPTNPSSGYTANQTPTATLASNSASAYSIADLSKVYAGTVSSWKRGVLTFDGKRQVVVQDEVTSPKAFDALWSMHTRATIRISSDGRTAMLYKDGQVLAARITSGSGATFVDAPSSPYPTSPNPAKQTANTGMRTLEIDLQGGAGTTTLAVQFSPVTGIARPDARPVVPLSRWTLDPAGSSMTPAAGTALPISGASSSYTSGKYGTPALSYDGSTATYFGVYGGTNGLGQTVTYSVPAGSVVKSARTSFVTNKEHRIDYAIETSADGSSWTRQYNGAYVGAAGDHAVRFASPQATRYVRFTLLGDTKSGDYFAAIAEARFYTYDVSSAAVPAQGATLASAALSGVPAALNVRQAAAMKVSAKNTSGAAVPVGAVDYVTSNPAVATVDASGVVRAVGVGTARVGAVVTIDHVRALAGTTVVVKDPSKVHTVSDSDAYVQAGSATKKNFGALGTLLVKPTPNGGKSSDVTRISYLHFTINSVKGKKVKSAVITLSAKVSDTRGTAVRVNGHLVTKAWAEKSITFATHPPLGGAIGSTVVVTKPGLVKMDITKFVNSKYFTGSFTVGLTEDAPKNNRPLLVNIDSRQSKNPPALDVQLQ